MSTQKKVFFKFKKSFFNFTSSIRSEKTFRANINLFDFKKSLLQTFLNERNYFPVRRTPKVSLVGIVLRAKN